MLSPRFWVRAPDSEQGVDSIFSPPRYGRPLEGLSLLAVVVRRLSELTAALGFNSLSTSVSLKVRGGLVGEVGEADRELLFKLVGRWTTS